MEKIDVVRRILRHVNRGQFVNSVGTAWAPSNVALCKYWGKRDQELNLPVTSSLSVSLGNKGSFTKIRQQEDGIDSYAVNGVVIGSDTGFAKRLSEFLDLFRPRGANYSVEVDTNVPIAAGFASSACGFASLVRALDKLYDWRLSLSDLSILARLGSGSASRSLFEGFVEWQRGDSSDGMDSYGVKLDHIWPELRIGMLTILPGEKAISSRVAMQHTVENSSLYPSWPGRVADDLSSIKSALASKDFKLFGSTAENNAVNMHNMMKISQPSVIYSTPETMAAINRVQEIRQAGIPLFFTQDAGPNLQLLFLATDEDQILRIFPELEIVMPFVDINAERVIVVNERNIAVDICEKIAAHVQGRLHRAFSVVILRQRGSRIEMLLQRRSGSKYHSANLWSNACCGHPRPGEDVKIAANRRLKEEMGFGVALEEIGSFHYRAEFPDVCLIENEIDHVFVGFSGLEEFSFNSAEVQEYRWLDISELSQELKVRRAEYTAWLPFLFEFLRGKRSEFAKC